MKTILFLLGAYYPRPKANGVCCDTVIQELLSRGHKVIVISYDSSELNKHSYVKNLQVFNIKGTCYYRSLIAKEDGKIIKYSVLNLFHHFQLFLSYFTSRKDRLTENRFYKKALEIMSSTTIDTIVGVNSPIPAVSATSRLKKKYPQIKTILYLLDPISNSFLPKSSFQSFMNSFLIPWERKMFYTVDSIVFMKSIQNYYLSLYHDESLISKFHFFDIPTFKSCTVQKNYPLESDSRYRLLYVGSLPSGIRNPDFMLEVLSQKQLCEQISLLIIGVTEDVLSLDKYPNLKVRCIPYADHRTVLNNMEKADILLNIGNRYGNMVPSKIFEYLSFGKPIIHFYNYSEDSCLPYLKSYPLIKTVHEDLNTDSVFTAALEIDQFISENINKRVAPEILQSLYIQNTPLPFANLIESI